MTSTDPNANPPVPPGWRLMPQASVTPAMQARVDVVFADATTYPMFWSNVEDFSGVAVLIRVEHHTPDSINPKPGHRGVTLYEQASPGEPAQMPEGVDASHYQGTPDWKRVADEGISFAFMKASEGAGLVDGSFATNWTSAKGLLLRGAYHFFRAGEDAATQATFFLSRLGADQGELPPALDVEVTDGVSMALLASGVRSWLTLVGRALAPGKKPLVYTSPGFWSGISTVDAIVIAQLSDLWIAHWGVAAPHVPGAWKAATFWQYTDKRAVGFSSLSFDGDRFMGSPTELAAYAGTGAPPAQGGPFSFALGTVSGVQAALNALGYRPPLAVDGIHGPLTSDAIAAFKAATKTGPLA